MLRNSSGPTCAIACTPKLLAGIAALMKRDDGIWNVTLPASTRRRISSSSPSYHTRRLLLASNSRWLSKSTSTCRRWATTPLVRIAYKGFGVIVGNRSEERRVGKEGGGGRGRARGEGDG